MPELPEVETVKETLKKIVLNKTIKEVKVYYEPMIVKPSPNEFISQLENQKIIDIKRKGKWLIFELDNYYLLSHLRMEGKYQVKDLNYPVNKHEHVSFVFDDFELRYVDTRKFGRMYLQNKETAFNESPLSDLGLEPWDNNLTKDYLKNKYKNKSLPIKTLLLDQSIITGIGNIYDDEILFASKINPFTKGRDLNDKQLESIITNTKIVLEKAIKKGGTTIRTYESSEGVHGRFQNELLVHTKEICPICGSKIVKTKINGRGTYYCEKCQK
ncbi:MAG: DNA-formamidopyrimidine glycosylase [Bacilli bacterium]|nr:DNA-formamidopyrimidine glycosylase [Bacilli bacterium]